MHDHLHDFIFGDLLILTRKAQGRRQGVGFGGPPSIEGTFHTFPV